MNEEKDKTDNDLNPAQSKPKNKVGRPLLFATPELMQEKIDAYFLTRQPEFLKDEAGNILKNSLGRPLFKLNPPTISGLALFLGFTDRTSLYEYKGYGDEFSDTVKRATTRIASFAEEITLSGENWGGAAFWLKNHGWCAEEKRVINAEVVVNDLSNLAPAQLKAMAEAAGLKEGGADDPAEPAETNLN